MSRVLIAFGFRGEGVETWPLSIWSHHHTWCKIPSGSLAPLAHDLCSHPPGERTNPLHPVVAAASSIAAGAVLAIAPNSASGPTQHTPEFRAQAPGGHAEQPLARPTTLERIARPMAATPRPASSWSAELDAGRIQVYIDRTEWDMHITAERDYDHEVMESLLVALEGRGYEVMPEDECPVELLDDGRCRIYLASTEWDEAA